MREHLITLVRALHHTQEAGEPAKVLELGEEAVHVPYMVALRLITVDEMSDEIGVTTDGRLFAGIRPDGHMDLPVEVAELTQNVEERELAARYIDGKIAGVDHHILHATNPAYVEAYEHCGIVLKCIAREFRMGMHLPATSVPEARVIPYNESNDTGIRHETALRNFFVDVHGRNVKAGWWSDLETGEPKKRSVGEIFVLFVTEMAEAYEAWEAHQSDDKLPQYPGLGVELADLGIRWADFCGAAMEGKIVDRSTERNPGDIMFRQIVEIAKAYEAIRKSPAAVGPPETGGFLEPMDIAMMTDAKLAFNANRPDHKIENRLKEDGKRT